MFCPDCGLKNRPRANFCANCRYSFRDKVSGKPRGSASGVDGSNTEDKTPDSTPVLMSPSSGNTPMAMPPGILPAGFLLDCRYRIVEHIATGGMGAIYRGRDERLNTDVAVKEMLDFFQTHEERKYATQRFREEALLLADLRHPNIPRVTDNFIQGGRYYLVMDYVRGTDTEKIINRLAGKGLPPERVIPWAIQMCDVLYYLHSRKPSIIYRDMKPSNVIIRDEDDQVMLVDFGIARHFIPRRPGTMIGTQGYAPPEQYKGRTEPRSDLYALGATLHHLITGNDPTAGVPFSFKPVSHYRKDTPPQLDDVFRKALENQVELRFTSAGEMKEAFIKIASLTGADPVSMGASKADSPGFIPSPPSYDDRYRQRLYNDALNHFNRAKELADQRRFNQARRELKKALGLSPGYPEAHSLMGYVLIRLGRHREALKHLGRAVALKPGSATAHFYMGKAHACLGNFSESQKEYQEAGRLDPAIFRKQKTPGFIEKLISTLLS